MDNFGVTHEPRSGLIDSTAGGDRPLQPEPANETPGLLTSLHDLLFGREIFSGPTDKAPATRTTNRTLSSRRFAEERRTAP